jgi:hypothetical protein
VPVGVPTGDVTVTANRIPEPKTEALGLTDADVLVAATLTERVVVPDDGSKSESPEYVALIV